MATTDLVLGDKKFAISQAGLVNNGEQLAVDVSEAGSIVAHVKNYGTVALLAGAFAFEGSIDSANGIDGTWFPIQMSRVSDGTVETSASGINIGVGSGNVYAWEASVAAIKWFRIRTTTSVTASAIAYWSVFRSSKVSESAPAIQPHGVFPAVGSAVQLISSANTNPLLVKGAPGTLTEIAVFNPTASVQYVKLYNKATAPVPATDSAFIMFAFPVAVNAGVVFNFGPLGKRFPLGIALAITGAAALADATATAAGSVTSLTYI